MMTNANDGLRFLAQRITEDAAKYGVRFGDRKVFLSTVESIDLTDTADLEQMRRLGLLNFARADLVAAMDPAMVAASEWRTSGAQYHFLILEV